MSLREFEDFVYGACLLDWEAERERCSATATASTPPRRSGSSAPAPISRSASPGATAQVDAGGANMPGGEFFYCPVEDSAEGTIAFELPGTYQGREVSGIRLRFEDGRVVDASAETNEAYLLELLDVDEGARRVGELGIGCNPGITRHMKNAAYDEKIDGTVHVALGDRLPVPGRDERRAGSTGTSSRTCATAGADPGRGARPGGREVADLTAEEGTMGSPASVTAGSLFRQRPLVALLVAEVVSSLGSQMTFLALPWFVLVTTGSAAKMGIVLAVELLPVALLGIPSGTLVARLGARQTMLIGDAARFPIMVAIPLLHSAGLLTLPDPARAASS